MIMSTKHWDREINEPFYHSFMTSKGLFSLVNDNHLSAVLTESELQALAARKLEGHDIKIFEPRYIAQRERHHLCPPFEAKIYADGFKTQLKLKYKHVHSGELAELEFDFYALLFNYLAGPRSQKKFVEHLYYAGFGVTRRCYKDHTQLFMLIMLTTNFIYRGKI